MLMVGGTLSQQVDRWVTCNEIITTSIHGSLRKVRIVHLESHPCTAAATPPPPPPMPPVFRIASTCTLVERADFDRLTSDLQQPRASYIDYSSIGGLVSQVAAVREIVDLNLHHGQRFRSFGLTPPSGILLYGPPGTGKTLIARAVAHQCQASVIVVNSPEVIGKFYGESEQRLREIFDSAITQAPCILFLDEIDAICGRRDDVCDATP
jgi:ATP-dependent 26S proteasome regulatory subunit